MYALSEANLDSVHGGVVFYEGQGVSSPASQWALDAAATRPPGTNSWGETVSSWDCTQVRVLDIVTTTTIPQGCNATTSAPFFVCTFGSSSTQTVTQRNTITCTAR